MSDGHREPIEAALTPDEANRIIHSHRKVRYGKLGSLDLSAFSEFPFLPSFLPHSTPLAKTMQERLVGLVGSAK